MARVYTGEGTEVFDDLGDRARGSLLAQVQEIADPLRCQRLQRANKSHSSTTQKAIHNVPKYG